MDLTIGEFENMKPTIKEYRVRFVAPEGAAYGINMDTGEEVFINSAITTRMGLELGDLIRAAVVPNNKSENVADYALMAEALEED